MTASSDEPQSTRWPWFMAFSAIVIALVAVTYLYYRSEFQHAVWHSHNQLHSISMLKATQIEQWRRERIAGLRMLVNSPFFSKAVQEFMTSPKSALLEGQIRRRLDAIRIAYYYHDAVILDKDMEIKVSLKQDIHILDIEAKKIVEDALLNNRIAFGDFYRCSICSGIHIDVAAPIADDFGTPIAIVVFRIDPESELYKLIQSWPVSSETGETLLVKKKADKVLVLNELRHRTGTALNLFVPITDKEDATVKAFDGGEGFVQGRDYRGVEVFADAQPIAGSPWVMMAKVDREESLSDLKYRAAVAGLFCVIIIALCGTSIGLHFLRREKTLYQTLYQSEKRTSEAKEEFRITLESIGDAVITTDTQGCVRYMNPVAEALTGWSASEALNREVTQVFNVVDEQTGLPAKNPVTAVLETGSKVSLDNETVLVSRLGGRLPIADSGAPIKDANGNIVGVVLVFRDQTEQRATQKALQKSRDKAEQYLDVSSQIVLSLDVDGKIVMVNNEGLQLLGYKREELLGKDWFDTCLATEDRGLVRQVFNSLMLGEHIDIHTFENPIITKDGSKRVILWHNTVLKNEDGEIIGTLSSGEDITDRKRAEEDTRAARKDWEDIFHAINHPTMIIDQNHDILNINKAILEATGRSVNELIGAKCYEIFHGSGEPPAQCPAAVLLRSGVSSTLEMEMPALGGYFLVSCTPVIDEEGKIRKIIHIATDITHLKRMEKEREALRTQLVQAQKMEAVGTLAGGLAHDFNNILQATLGYAELLLMDRAFPDSYRAHIKMIYESSKRGADLARRMLVFSRRTDIELKPMSLNKLVSEAVKLLERTIPKMISIELFLQDDLPLISGDQTELEQVVINLAINARDAMPDGGRLTLETREVVLDEAYARTHFGCQPGRYVLLEVSDTGVGMDETTLSRIYEPFFTTKESGKGTGLGLSVVYGIVKQHGGRIGCYSELGKGTTFKIYFPIINPSEDETETEDTSVVGGTETILLVDDEASMRDLGTRLLSSAGYTVLLASNGREALDIYKANQDSIALVLLDLIMPEMGGIQCMRDLLAVNPSLKIVVTSGYSANGVSQEARDFGAKDFIQKPFELHRVLRQVREVLDAPTI